METQFFELFEMLKHKIATNKPGADAHKLMMPEGRLLYPSHLNPPQPSAILIALFENNNELFFPVIRRPIYDGLHSGQIAFPGGKFETSDATLINTALRESYEEIGINRNDVNILGTLSPLYIPITNMEILPLVGYLKSPPNYSLDPHEVDTLFNIKLNDILNPSNKVIEKWTIRGNEVDVPFYHIQEQKIWGATAMILSELEQLLMQTPTYLTY